jgi:hypothetical protein
LPFKKFKPFNGVPARHEESTTGPSEACFFDGFSPRDVGDTLRGVVKGCAAEDMADGCPSSCRGFACSMVLVEMACASLVGVVAIARRDDVEMTLKLRARRRAHRRQIMADVKCN